MKDDMMASPARAPIEADWLLTGISRLVTMAPDTPAATGPLGIIERAAIAARNGKVVWIGAENALAGEVELSAISEHARFDAGGRAVLPGFVDSHTHFIFAGDRASEFQLRHAGASYEEIAERGGGIVSTVRATRSATADELIASGRDRLRSFAAHGTTTVEGKTGYGLDLETESRCLDAMRALAAEPGAPRIVPTFLGAHTLPPEYRGGDEPRARYVDLVVETMLPALAGRARFCDVFCERSAFTVAEARRILTAARDQGYALKLHANQLAESGGAELGAELGAVSADHLDHVSDETLRSLARARVVATLLPGCAFTLATPYPDARRYYAAGLDVALATDFNPGTSYCENMQMMIALAVSAMHMTLEQALRAATMGGALALGMADQIGSLTPGKSCDVIVLRGADERELAYHFGVNLVARTFIASRPSIAASTANG